MKWCFMGSDPIALPMLRYLHSTRPGGIELKAVYTQPDRRTGRGMHLQANAIKSWALDNGIEVRQPAKCGKDEAAWLGMNGIDLVIVMAYGQILPRSILEATPLGIVNLHASLLPRLRGASPIHTAIACGLEITGVSLMRIIPKLDAGPVAAREVVAIGDSDTCSGVVDKLAQACIPLMEKALPALLQGKLDFQEQDQQQVTYCRIIEKTDCHLDFSADARELANRIRAFQPWPGTAFPHGDMEIRIVAALAEDTEDDYLPGMLTIDAEGTVRIRCGQGSLVITRMQRPGGKPMEADAFLRGYPIDSGTILPSRSMHPLEGSQPFPYKQK